MKLKISSITLATICLLTAASQAGAAPVWTRDLTNGTVCKPMLPSQSDLVEYKSWGLLNATTTTDVWVLCPFHQIQTKVVPALVSTTVAMTNRNDFPVSGNCLFREVDIDGQVINTWSKPFTLPANDADNLLFAEQLADSWNTMTFACQLMRNTYMSLVNHWTWQP